MFVSSRIEIISSCLRFSSSVKKMKGFAVRFMICWNVFLSGNDPLKKIKKYLYKSEVKKRLFSTGVVNSLDPSPWFSCLGLLYSLDSFHRLPWAVGNPVVNIELFFKSFCLVAGRDDVPTFFNLPKEKSFVFRLPPPTNRGAESTIGGKKVGNCTRSK